MPSPLASRLAQTDDILLGGDAEGRHLSRLAHGARLGHSQSPRPVPHLRRNCYLQIAARRPHPSGLEKERRPPFYDIV
jgi:hypothetical protein